MTAASDVFEEMRKKLLGGPTRTDEKHHPKVTIVGVGEVGMACASSVLQKGLAREIALVDVLLEKVEGNRMDLAHGAALFHPVEIRASDDYAITANSDVCIITAGVRQRTGESRLDLIGRNVQIFKKIVPDLAKHSPNAVIIVVSNPVDVLTWVVWKLSGFPSNRVIGSGTMLDSSRFTYLLAEKLHVFPQSIQGYMIGEHGDSSVPVWSSISVGGVRLRDLNPDFGKGFWADVAKEVKESAYAVIKLKGYTSWSIGMCVAVLTEAVVRNSRQIFPVSVLAQGFHGIKEDVFLSLPAVLTNTGVSQMTKQILDDSELQQLRDSAKTIYDIQKQLTL